MSWLDAVLNRANEARRQAEPAPLPAIAKPEKPRQPKPEIKSTWYQRRRPQHANDTGEVALAHYSIAADGVLTMHDEDGKPIQKYPLRPDEDPRAVASRLGGLAWRENRDDFNRPLSYPPIAIV